MSNAEKRRARVRSAAKKRRVARQRKQKCEVRRAAVKRAELAAQLPVLSLRKEKS